MYNTKLESATHSSAVLNMPDESLVEDAKLCVINEQVLNDQLEHLKKIKAALNKRIENGDVTNAQIATEMDKLKPLYQDLLRTLPQYTEDSSKDIARSIIEKHRSCASRVRAISGAFSETVTDANLDDFLR